MTNEELSAAAYAMHDRTESLTTDDCMHLAYAALEAAEAVRDKAWKDYINELGIKPLEPLRPLTGKLEPMAGINADGSLMAKNEMAREMAGALPPIGRTMTEATAPWSPYQTAHGTALDGSLMTEAEQQAVLDALTRD